MPGITPFTIFALLTSVTCLFLASITRSIIESHKGKIKVKSDLGKGTEFILEMKL